MQQKPKELKPSQLRLVPMCTEGGAPTVHIVSDESLPWPLERELDRVRREIVSTGEVPFPSVIKVLRHKGRNHDLIKVVVPSGQTRRELIKRLRVLLSSTRPLKCEETTSEAKKRRYRPVNRRLGAHAH